MSKGVLGILAFFGLIAAFSGASYLMNKHDEKIRQQAEQLAWTKDNYRVLVCASPGEAHAELFTKEGVYEDKIVELDGVFYRGFVQFDGFIAYTQIYTPADYEKCEIKTMKVTKL